MSHLSAPAFAVLFAVAGVIAAIIVTAAGKSGAGKRLGAALASGVILGAFFVGWITSIRHAAFAEAASGAHMSAANLRADGLIGAALALTVILFAVATAASRKPSARTGARELPPAPRRGVRRRAGAVR
jgi:hypothetical protein